MIMPPALVLVVFCGFVTPPGVGLIPTGPPQAYVAPLPSLGPAVYATAVVPEVPGMAPLPQLVETLGAGRSRPGRAMEGRVGPDRSGARASVALALSQQPRRSSYDWYVSLVRERTVCLREARRALDS